MTNELRAKIEALPEHKYKAGCVSRADVLALITTPPAPQETAREAVEGSPERIWAYHAAGYGGGDDVIMAETVSHWDSGNPVGVEYVRADLAHPIPAAAPTDNAALVEELRQEISDLQSNGLSAEAKLLERAVAALSTRPAEATSREGVETTCYGSYAKRRQSKERRHD